MRIVFPHSLADVAADRINQLPVHTILEHTCDGMVSEIVWSQIVKPGDLAQVVPRAAQKPPCGWSLRIVLASFDAEREEVVLWTVNRPIGAHFGRGLIVAEFAPMVVF